MSTPFQITSLHGIPIRGDLHLPAVTDGAPVIIICHGFKGFKDWGGFSYAADYFASQGFAALRFNFSLNGVEDRFLEFTALENFARNTISRELDDLHDLIDAVCAKVFLPEEIDAGRIGLVGHSLGGGVVVVHASDDDRIGAVAGWAGVADFMRWGKKTRAMWRKSGRMEIENARTHQMMPMDVGMLEDLEANRERFDIPAAVSRLTVPLLVVHGEQDVSVPIEEGRRIAAAADPAHCLLHVIPNTDHTFGVRHPFEGPTPAFETVLGSTAAFFCEAFEV
jgi:dienelactone hydrolase